RKFHLIFQYSFPTRRSSDLAFSLIYHAIAIFYSSNVNHQGDGVEEEFENIAFLLINLFIDFEPSLEPPRPEFLKEFLLCSSSSPIKKGVIPASLILTPPTSSCWATSIASSLLPANT